MLMTAEICWEIFTNPNDLYIYITHKQDVYGFVIGRGAQGNYKVLVTFTPALSSQKSTAELVQTYLSHALAQGKQIQEHNYTMPGVDSLVANIPFLDEEIINKIFRDLKNSGEVNTHTFFITSPH